MQFFIEGAIVKLNVNYCSLYEFYSVEAVTKAAESS